VARPLVKDISKAKEMDTRVQFSVAFSFHSSKKKPHPPEGGGSRAISLCLIKVGKAKAAELLNS
jgi:hypothetical protein